MLWNQLSYEAKTADSLYMFKNYIRPWITSLFLVLIYIYITHVFSSLV